MRFTTSIVGASGKMGTKHAVLTQPDPTDPQKKKTCCVVRMDDNEEFRVLFENDWATSGSVVCKIDKIVAFVGVLEAGEFVASDTHFFYRRTTPGGCRVVETEFTRDGATPHATAIHLINNDYNADGSAVQIGCVTGDSIRGRATDHLADPDRSQRA